MSIEIKCLRKFVSEKKIEKDTKIKKEILANYFYQETGRSAQTIRNYFSFLIMLGFLERSKDIFIIKIDKIKKSIEKEEARLVEQGIDIDLICGMKKNGDI